jgi:arylsulfatase A-like enzyme
MDQQAPAVTNIIWIFGDQHRAQALSSAGDPNVNTPHIDTLAAQGVQFTEAVATYPLCCPARGSLLTGRYAPDAVPGHEYQLPPVTPTIADAFNDAGYDTAYFGKWHVDGYHESEGRAAFHTVPKDRRGRFGTWLGYENNNSQWDCYLHGHRGDEEVAHRRLPGYETDELTGELEHYLREDARKVSPFFAVLSVQPPHDPYLAPAEYAGRRNPQNIHLRANVPPVARVEQAARRDLAGYYGMIENLDDAVGRIQAVLEETGLIETTRIIFFSDHGDLHGSHGQFRKTSPYEESVRVPFIVGPRGRYAPLRRSTQVPWLIGQADLAPTTLGLCGIPVPKEMGGFDYSALITAAEAPGAGRVAETGISPPDSALIHSLIPTGHANSVDKSWRGIITSDRWKYVCFDSVAWLLFNLEEDPFELVNLAHEPKYRGIRKRLADQLQRAVAASGDSFQVPAK